MSEYFSWWVGGYKWVSRWVTVNEWMCGLVSEWVSGSVSRQVGGWVSGWVSECTHLQASTIHNYPRHSVSQKGDDRDGCKSGWLADTDTDTD